MIITDDIISLARWRHHHCVKSVRIWSFSCPYFPALRPEKLRIRTLFTQCIHLQLLSGVTDASLNLMSYLPIITRYFWFSEFRVTVETSHLHMRRSNLYSSFWSQSNWANSHKIFHIYVKSTSFKHQVLQIVKILQISVGVSNRMAP